MNTLRCILKTLIILVAQSEPAGWSFTYYQLIRRHGKMRIRKRIRDFSPEEMTKEKPKSPVIVILRGTGIIAKTVPQGSEFLNAVADEEEFVHASEPVAENQVRLTFLRKTLWDSLTDRISALQPQIAETHITVEDQTIDAIRAIGDDFTRRELTFRNLIRPTPAGNVLASLITSKLLKPLLVVAFIVLGMNYAVNRHLQNTVYQQQTELDRLQKDAEADRKERSEKEKVKTPDRWKSVHPHGIVADRIAASVPLGVMLTAMTINPLEKKIQRDKPLQVSMNKVRIAGLTPDAEPVNRFVAKLKGWEWAHNVRLLSYDKDRSVDYRFEIEIELSQTAKP